MQAAVAAIHDQSTRHENTDWNDIAALYPLLERMTANPMVTFNRAVATASWRVTWMLRSAGFAPRGPCDEPREQQYRTTKAARLLASPPSR